MKIFGEWIKLRKGIGIAAVSIMLALALVASGFAPAGAAAEKERVAKIGLAACFTGPLATLGTPFGEGMIDHVRYINEQGGIDGVKLEVVWYETKAFVPGCIIAHRRFVEQGVVIEHIIQATPAEAVLPFSQRDEMPATIITALTPHLISKPQWYAVSYVDWPSLFMMAIKWIKENRWTEERPMRIGYVFYDSSSGWAGLDATKYFDRMGIEFVGYEVIPFIGCIDTSTEILRLAGKKPDWIYFSSYGTPTITFVKDAARLEIQQKGIRLMASPNNMVQEVLNIVGRDANGWHLGKATPCYFETEKFPGMKTIAEKAKEYRGIKLEEIKDFYTGGWVHSAVAVEAIRLAVEKVGYQNLTGRAVRDGLFSIKDFDTGFVPVITISEDAPFIIPTYGIYQISGEGFHPIDWTEPIPSLYKSPQEFERALEK